MRSTHVCDLIALLSHTGPYHHPTSSEGQGCQHCVSKKSVNFTIRVIASHRPAHAQEEPAGWGAFLVFAWGYRNLLQDRVKIMQL